MRIEYEEGKEALVTSLYHDEVACFSIYTLVTPTTYSLIYLGWYWVDDGQLHKIVDRLRILSFNDVGHKPSYTELAFVESIIKVALKGEYEFEN